MNAYDFLMNSDRMLSEFWSESNTIDRVARTPHGRARQARTDELRDGREGAALLQRVREVPALGERVLREDPLGREAVRLESQLKK